MRMLVTRPMPPETAQAAGARFDVTWRDSNAPCAAAEMRAALAEHDIVLASLGDAFSAEVFAAVPEPRCRLIANFGVGTNHIDVAAARAAGIAVTNTPGAVTDATADIALTLILMTARRAGEGERLVRSGRWESWHPTQMLGLHVTGKTVGIVGMGRIGKAIAARCHNGFGMRVRFFNRSPVADPGVPAEQVATLAELMGGADIVVIAVPGGPGTWHLIDAAALAAMRPGAILINIARGEIVDEAALIAALEAGTIGGAGLDVYEFEPVVPEALIRQERAVLLPHLGTAAMEVRENMGMMALANALAHLDGRPLPNAV